MQCLANSGWQCQWRHDWIHLIRNMQWYDCDLEEIPGYRYCIGYLYSTPRSSRHGSVRATSQERWDSHWQCQIEIPTEEHCMFAHLDAMVYHMIIVPELELEGPNYRQPLSLASYELCGPIKDIIRVENQASCS